MSGRAGQGCSPPPAPPGSPATAASPPPAPGKTLARNHGNYFERTPCPPRLAPHARREAPRVRGRGAPFVAALPPRPPPPAVQIPAEPPGPPPPARPRNFPRRPPAAPPGSAPRSCRGRQQRPGQSVFTAQGGPGSPRGRGREGAPAAGQRGEGETLRGVEGAGPARLLPSISISSGSLSCCSPGFWCCCCC